MIFFRSILSLFFISSLTFSCRTYVPISQSQQIPHIIEELKNDRDIEVEHNGTTKTVRTRMEPELQIIVSSPCKLDAWKKRECDLKKRKFRALIDQIELIHDPQPILFFVNDTSIETEGIQLADIEQPKLIFDRVDVVEAAAGITIGGPLGSVGFQLHYFPIEEAVIDVSFGALFSMLFAAGGARFRPLNLNFVRPYLGFAFHYSYEQSDNAYRSSETSAGQHFVLAGPRFGFDFELPHRRFLIGLEADIMYDFTGEGNVFYNTITSHFLSTQGNLVPSMGMYFALQFSDIFNSSREQHVEP